MKKLLLLFLTVIYGEGCAQNSIPIVEDHSSLNLDFEQVRPDNTPTRWFLSKGKNFEFFLDTLVVFSGKRSLRIRSAAQASAQSADAGSSILIDDVRGKKVTLLGYIRTADLIGGDAYLELAVYNQSNLLAVDTMGGRGVNGTTEWKQYKAEVYVDSAAATVSFGVGLQSGSKGSAWFDKLEILIDDKPYERKLFTLKDDQLDWLKHAAQPFKTSKAESGFEDLGTIKDIVGSAEIVGLGEATHGTKEFSEMKHRLVEYLASNMGFTIFSFEGDMAEAYEINDYIHGGPGNVRKLLQGKYFYGVNTKEFEDMIEWMHRYNASCKGQIEFTGFDMQSGEVAGNNVTSFLKKYDPAYADTVQRKYNTLRKQIIAKYSMQSNQVYDSLTFAACLNETNRILMHMQTANYQKTASQKETDWAIQNANIVLQASQMMLPDIIHSSYYRDSCMAENVRWIKDHAPPGAKLILWAHNGHIAKSDGWRMGVHLKRIYEKKYRAIGFKFHEGTYTAWTRAGLSPSNVATAFDPGTLDWIFHSLGMPRFILDLQKTSAQDPRSGWLYQKLETKDIGGAAEDGYIFQKVPDRWDAIIFFDKTSSINCYDVFK